MEINVEGGNYRFFLIQIIPNADIIEQFFMPGHLYSTNILYYQKNFLSQFKDKMFTIASFNIKFFTIYYFLNSFYVGVITSITIGI